MPNKDYDNTRTKIVPWNSPLGWARITAIHGVICAKRGYCSDKWTDEDLDEARELGHCMHITGLPSHNRGRKSLKSIFDNGRRADKSYGNKFPPVVNDKMARGKNGGRPTKNNPQRISKKKKKSNKTSKHDIWSSNSCL